MLIIEDDAFSATALEAALTLAGFSIVAKTNTAMRSLEILSTRSIDVAVIDIDLGPGPSGIDIAHALRKTLPTLGIVFLTSFADPRLSKSGSLELPKGSLYFEKRNLNDIRTLGSLILKSKYQPLIGGGRTEPKFMLTGHQISILKYVAAGLTNAEISKVVDTSEKAVEHAISRISKNLGIANHGASNSRVLLVRAYAELSGKSLPTT